MARAITKVGIESIIYAYVVEHMENVLTANVDIDGVTSEIEYTDTLTVHGHKSLNAGQILCEKKFGKNTMCVHVEHTKTGKLTLSADGFLLHSLPCIEGVTYGHDFVTAEFTLTMLNVMYRDSDGMKRTTLQYNGSTTDSKLLNFAREELKCKQAVVTKATRSKVRRWMTRLDYEYYATLENEKKQSNNSAEAETENSNESTEE